MKILLYAILFLALIVSIFILPKALRVHKVKTLYDKDKIVHNFVNMDKIFPSRNIKASDEPKPIKKNIQTPAHILALNALKKLENKKLIDKKDIKKAFWFN